MPTIGGVYIPDDQMPQLPAARSARPGLGDLLASGGQGAITALRYGLPYALDAATGTSNPENDAYYQGWLERGAAASERSAPGGPMSYRDVDGVGSGLRFVAENLTYSLPYMLPTLAGGIAGSAAGPGGTVAGALAGGSALFGGTNTQRAAEDGSLTQGEAIRSLAVAPAQAAADALVGRYLPGVGNALGKLAATQTAKGFTTRTLQSMGKAALTEAATETAQQVGERFAAGLPMSGKEALEEYTTAFITGGAVGGALGLGGGFRGASKDLDPNAPLEEFERVLDTELKLLPAPRQRGNPNDPTSGPTVYAGTRGRATEDLETATLAAAASLAPGGDLSAQAGIGTPQQTAAALELLQRQRSGELDGDRLSRELELERRAAMETPALSGPPSPLGQGDIGARNTADPIYAGGPGEASSAAFPAQLSRAISQMPSGDIKAALKRQEERGDIPPQIVDALNFEVERRARDEQDARPFEEMNTAAKLRNIKSSYSSQFTKKLEAASEEELLTKINDYVVDRAKGGKKDTALAQRLGLLDEAGKPTDLSREVSARKAAADEAALTPNSRLRTPEFQAELKKLLGKRTTADDVKALDPVDEADLDAQIYRALAGREGTVQERVAEIMGEEVIVSPSSAMEALAVKRGLVTGKLDKQGQPQGGMELTEKGRAVAEMVDAEPAPPTISANETEEVLGRVGRDAPDADAMARAALKQRIEALAEPAEERSAGFRVRRQGVKRDDIMRLQQMVDQGAAPAEVEQAMARAQAGEPLFDQPAPAARETSQQRIERLDVEAAIEGRDLDPEGAALERGRRRRQLESQVVARREQAERSLQRTPSRAEARAETKTLVDKKSALIAENLKAAYDSGDITSGQLAAGLQALRRGEFKNALSKLPGITRDALVEHTGRASVGDTVRIDGILKRAGDTFDGAIAMLKAEAGNQYERQLVDKIAKAVKEMRAQGVGFQFSVHRPGDTSPEFAENPLRAGFARAADTDDGSLTIEIAVRGANAGGASGTDFETIVHEMVHAVTMANVFLYTNTNTNVLKGPKRQAVEDLQRVSQAVRDHIATRLAQGATLTPLENSLVNNGKRMDYMVGNLDELIAWGLTNAEFQGLLETVQVDGRSLWERFVDAIRVLLGLPDKARTALEEVIRASSTLMDNTQLMAEGELVDAAMSDMLLSKVDAPAMSEAVGDRVKQTVAGSQDVWNHTIKAKARPVVLGFSSLFHLAKQYGDKMPGIAKYYRSEDHRRATLARLDQMAEPVQLKLEELRAKDPKAADKVGELMTYTQWEIDPAKPWSAHQHLHGHKNAATLQRLVGKANQTYLQYRGRGTEIYNEFKALNEMGSYAAATLSVYNIIGRSSTLRAAAGVLPNPMDGFRTAANVNESPLAARDYWKEAFAQQKKLAENIAAKMRSDTLGATGPEQNRVAAMLTPLEQQLKIGERNISAIEQAPYFHLGRHGDHYVTFEVAKRGNVADPAAVAKLAAALKAAGHEDAYIDPDNTQSRVYIRTDNITSREQIGKLAVQLQKQGIVDPNVDVDADVRDALLATATPGSAMRLAADLVSKIKDDPSFSTEGLSKADADLVRQQRDTVASQVQAHLLEAMPDTALGKVLVKRDAKQGFSRDMVRNWATRYQMTTVALSNMSAAPEFDAAFEDMRNARNEAKRVTSPNHGDVDLMFDLLREMTLRNAQAPVRPDTSVSDHLRATAHAYFLGMSPSYVLLNMTQLGVLAWPELAKKHSYARSMASIAKSTPVAMRILKAAAEEGYKSGAKRAFDAVITQDVLMKAGVPRSQADFILSMIGRGIIDIGGATRELGRLASGNTSDRWENGLRIAGAAGLYSETFSRLVTALAARDLHTGPDAVEYAAEVVHQSMLNYSETNVARYLGANSPIAGPTTKIVTQFMQYSLQVFEKMYRELHNLAARGGTADQRKEAAKFLAGHAMAMTSIAGVLGLPFATVVAKVVEMMVDMVDDDDDPFDATAAMRNFLADALGETGGEMLSRGVISRGLGIDLAQRAGEQDLLPFSKFLADRRTLKERIEQQAADSTGPSIGMVESILGGAGMIMDGEFMRGTTELMPTAIKGLFKAGMMYEGGYVDGKGNRIPIDEPGTREILVQAIGFNPAEKAEFSEVKGDQASRKGVLTRKASRLRRQIADAIIDGDGASARELLVEAQEFDRSNPAFAVLPDIQGTIKRRQRTRTLIEAGVPPGVSLKDIQGQQLTRYANY